VHELVQVAVHHGPDLGRLIVGPQVLHHLVGHEHIGADLVSPGDVAFIVVMFFLGGSLLFLFHVVKFGLEHLHGDLAVLELRPFDLAGDHDSRRDVRDAHGGLHLVHVLSPVPAGPEGVQLQIALVDVDLDGVVHFGDHVAGRKRRVPPRVGIERRDPHQPVRPRFGLQKTVCIRAFHEEGHPAEPRAVAGQDVRDVGLEPFGFRPAAIHPQQHVHPIARFGPSRPGMERDDGVVPVHGARQLRPHLDVGDDLLESGQPLGHFGAFGFVAGFLGQVVVRFQVVPVFLDLVEGLDGVFQRARLFHDLAGPLCLVPEGGVGYLLFEVGQLFLFPGNVKETSRAGPRKT